MLPKHIVVIGAGTCKGKFDIEGGGFVEMLRRYHETQARENYVYNLGISGDTTESMMMRLSTELKPRSADLVIINTGYDDIARTGGRDSEIRTPAEEYKHNIHRLVIRAQADAEVVFVSNVPFDETRTCPVSWGNLFYRMDDAQQYVQITREVCDELGLLYVDVFNPWLAVDYKGLLDADGFHPNANGHLAIFKALIAELEQQYGEESENQQVG